MAQQQLPFPNVEPVTVQHDRWVLNVRLNQVVTLSVTVTETAAAVTSLLQRIRGQPRSNVVGLSVHHALNQRADVLTLCCGNDCLIILLYRQHRFYFNDDLYEFLSNRERTFVGLGPTLNFYRNALTMSNVRLTISRLVNLQNLAFGGVHLQPQQFGQMCLNYPPNIDAAVEAGNWHVPFLMPEQVLHTSRHAYVNFSIGVQHETMLINQCRDLIRIGGQAGRLAAGHAFSTAAALLPDIAAQEVAANEQGGAN